MAGMDPKLAWDYTPGELLDYVEGYHRRREEMAYLLYDLAGAIAHACFGRSPLRPWDAFPGFIRQQETVMSDEDIYANCLAWAGMEEDEDGRR